MSNAEQIDKKYLAGLKYRSSTSKKTEEGLVNFPTERALKADDILDWKDNGASVTIVTADGQKYNVDKKAAEKAKE